VTTLGAGQYETSADVGLYPDEQSVTLIATARTIYGTAYYFAWVVSTRSALAFESALAQISERAVSPAPQAQAEIIDYQLATAPQSQAEIIEYKGAFSPGQTSLAFSLVEHEQALAELSMDGGASQEAISTLHSTIALSIESLMADLLALDLKDGAADYELARLSHMLAFEQLLSLGAVMAATEHETSSQGSLGVEGYDCTTAQNSLRVGSESFALLAQHTLGVEHVLTGEALGAISPATPDETGSLASIETEQGEGALVVCDLTGGELNEARE